MLKKLFKRVASATSQEESVMTTETVQPELAVDSQQVDMAAQLQVVNANLAEMTEKFAALKADYDKVSSAMAAVEAEKAEMAKQAQEAKMASRKEKMQAVLGEVEAAPVLASLENADDATFNTVLTAFSVNRKAEAASEMFQEQGVDAEPVAKADEEDTAARLAAKFAAQSKQ